MTTPTRSTLLVLFLLLLASACAATDTFLLNCGVSDRTSSTDEYSRVWTGDVPPYLSSSSSTPLALTASAHTPGVPAVPFLTASVFTTNFTYSIPASPGRAFLRLYFNPSGYGPHSPSDAVFDVVASGRYTLLKTFSPYLTSLTENLDHIVREFSLNVTSSDGPAVNITFSPSPNHPNSFAFVNGIELVSGAPNTFTRNPRKPLMIVGAGVQYTLSPTAAFETMHRLNVGGNTISPPDDSGGLDRHWLDDSPYILGAGSGITFSNDPNVTVRYTTAVPAFIAPRAIYETARSMPWETPNLNFNLTWTLPVDPGFYYLVRLHFCEVQYPFTRENQRVFSVYINNQTAATDTDVIAEGGGIGVPAYEDYVTFFAEGSELVDLWVQLHPYVDFRAQYQNVILNGLEVFKISRSDGDLAGPAAKAPVEGSGEPERESGGGGGGGGYWWRGWGCCSRFLDGWL